jgi:hypothetical protein
MKASSPLGAIPPKFAGHLVIQEEEEKKKEKNPNCMTNGHGQLSTKK